MSSIQFFNSGMRESSFGDKSAGTRNRCIGYKDIGNSCGDCRCIEQPGPSEYFPDLYGDLRAGKTELREKSSGSGSGFTLSQTSGFSSGSEAEQEAPDRQNQIQKSGQE